MSVPNKIEDKEDHLRKICTDVYVRVLPYGFDNFKVSHGVSSHKLEKYILRRWKKNGHYDKLKALVGEIFDRHYNEGD